MNIQSLVYFYMGRSRYISGNYKQASYGKVIKW